MLVEKKEKVTIPIHTYLDYYQLKSKYQKNKKCPNCKNPDIVFDVSDRILSIVCPTRGCKSNMRILSDTYITYNEQFSQCKQEYANTIEDILRAKFDILFDYRKTEKVEQLRDHYLQSKAEYDALYMKWQQKNPNHPELKKDRNELIQKLKQKYDDTIRDQLNHVLDQIQSIEYTRVYNDVVPTPVYDLEIRVL